MTPAQRKAAVESAAASLKAHPHCWTTPSLGLCLDSSPASTKKRCLFAHLAGMLGHRWFRLLNAGFSNHECNRILVLDEGCKSVDEMYERAMKLCEELWPEEAAKDRTFWETPFPSSPHEILLTDIRADEPQDATECAGCQQCSEPARPQGTTAFERLEYLLGVATDGRKRSVVNTDDLRTAVDFICRVKAVVEANPSATNLGVGRKHHALFEVRS